MPVHRPAQSQPSAAAGPRRVPTVLPPARDDVPAVVVAHGTAHLEGLLMIDALLERVRFLRPGLPVRLSFVSKAEPRPDVVLRELAATGAKEVVVLPLFLGSGYHVRHDIPTAVREATKTSALTSAIAGAPAQDRAGRLRVHVARALGPDPMLAQVLAERLGAVCGRLFGTEVVLAAAGSLDQRATADAVAMAGLLAERLGMPVRTAFLTAAEPSTAALLTRLSRRGRPVAVATYLLAEGGYTQRLRDTAALAGLEPGAVRTPRVAAPLGSHDVIARLLLRRYDQTLFG
ncbi:sirohydrochlorin chelatase [Actinospica durhamensis]|uniref:Sirohydrochlorin chelatase n=1 Tax=Actinospica durhamensis TaxID=1508375 RepID=A0A941ERX3_9ACTN|nr:sirohydrochlorin chelatase [Actinospica durhamensis]MBR7836048.1 sirohydrochlorin chelatase [Actinospica durhamensis]